ncbi:MAG: hypothetical protein K0Q49_578 [Haloplasmataceae bacterium]|jgi:hypothetical protein|nr:hypothetical protein [Haloplasmataceae bacterium]
MHGCLSPIVDHNHTNEVPTKTSQDIPKSKRFMEVGEVRVF